VRCNQYGNTAEHFAHELGPNPFLRDLIQELLSAEAQHAPLNSLHEAWAVIYEELDELWEEVRKKRVARQAARIRTELLQIAAMAWRAARDLGLEELPLDEREMIDSAKTRSEAPPNVFEGRRD
jgi:hypothetical protein